MTPSQLESNTSVSIKLHRRIATPMWIRSKSIIKTGFHQGIRIPRISILRLLYIKQIE